MKPLAKRLETLTVNQKDRVITLIIADFLKVEQYDPAEFARFFADVTDTLNDFDLNMTPQKFTATIDPQKWVNDYAYSVSDPPGETTWDCTAFIKADPERFGDVEDTIDEQDHWLDTNDALREDPNAPAWVKEWSGPFTITVAYADFN